MRKRKQLGKTLPWIALIMVLFLACFHMDEVTALHDNPMKQAEYLYSLIESESQ